MAENWSSSFHLLSWLMVLLGIGSCIFVAVDISRRLVTFVWFGRISPVRIEFWFMMQLAMACGFFTAYPMNWWLVRVGIKTAM